jgi:hypothetical protein
VEIRAIENECLGNSHGKKPANSTGGKHWLFCGAKQGTEKGRRRKSAQRWPFKP